MCNALDNESDSRYNNRITVTFTQCAECTKGKNMFVVEKEWINMIGEWEYVGDVLSTTDGLEATNCLRERTQSNTSETVRYSITFLR